MLEVKVLHGGDNINFNVNAKDFLACLKTINNDNVVIETIDEKVTINNSSRLNQEFINAIAKNNRKFELNGAYLDFEKGKIVATDTKILKTIDFEKIEGQKGIIIPKKALVIGCLSNFIVSEKKVQFSTEKGSI